MKHKGAKDAGSFNAFLQIALLNNWYECALRCLGNLKTWKLSVGCIKKEIIYSLNNFLAIPLLCEVQQATFVLWHKDHVREEQINNLLT